METKIVTIANMHCLFDYKGRKLPLLDRFNDLFYPALAEQKYVRVSSNKETTFYISEVQIVDLWDGELAVIGKHYKRSRLKLKQDFDYETGEEPIGRTEINAPYSTFVLLLRNHRIINIADQNGSPDIRSLASTIRSFLKQYKKSLYLNFRNRIDSFPITYDDIEFRNLTELKTYFDYKYPEAYVSVIAMLEDELVDQLTENLVKISSIRYRLRSTNCELDLSPRLRSLREYMEATNSDNAEMKISNPDVNEKVISTIKQSKGIAEFQLIGKNADSEKVNFTETSFSEKRPIDVDPELSNEGLAMNVYHQLRDKPEVTENSSQENFDYYEEFLAEFIED